MPDNRCYHVFGQRSHQMEDEFASWSCSVNLLRETDELDTALFEPLEQLNQMG